VPAAAQEITTSKQMFVRPSGTWTVTAAVRGKAHPIDLVSSVPEHSGGQDNVLEAMEVDGCSKGVPAQRTDHETETGSAHTADLSFDLGPGLVIGSQSSCEKFMCSA
jgi:hypothetical protein